MRRRVLLSTVGAGVTGGCVGGPWTDLGDGSTSSSARKGYETCDNVVVSTRSLPDDVEAEVLTALRDGSYEAETVLLGTAVDTDRSYLRHEGTFYEATIVATDGGERLTLRAVETPTLPEERTVAVVNRAPETETFTVRVEDGDLLVATVTLGQHDHRRYPVTDAFGTYHLQAEVGDETASLEWRVNESHFDAEVRYDDDGLEITQAVADMAPCPWDRP